MGGNSSGPRAGEGCVGSGANHMGQLSKGNAPVQEGNPSGTKKGDSLSAVKGDPVWKGLN